MSDTLNAWKQRNLCLREQRSSKKDIPVTKEDSSNSVQSEREINLQQDVAEPGIISRQTASESVKWFLSNKAKVTMIRELSYNVEGGKVAYAVVEDADKYYKSIADVISNKVPVSKLHMNYALDAAQKMFDKFNNA